MSKQKPVPPSPPSIPEFVPNIPLDEKVWNAWLKKNEEKDRAGAVKRAMFLKVLAVAVVVAAAVWRFAA